MTDIIARARKEWCAPGCGTRFDGYTVGPCPPDVIAALLDVLRDAHEFGYGPYGDTVCVSCAAEPQWKALDERVVVHSADCALVLADAAIAKALGDQKS